MPYETDKRVPIYRIYLNAKGKDKAKIIEEYITQCETVGQPYKLKYAIEDGRDDEIIILSYGEDLAKNIGTIEEITEGIDLGEPAKLTGRYKERIGIGEEYIQAPIHSYTETRLGLIPIIMQKYYLDHLDDFSTYLDEEHKKSGEFLLGWFKEASEDLGFEIGELEEDDTQERRRLENEQFAYDNNIEPDLVSIYETACKYIPEAMKKYMSEHLETIEPTIIENYRLACRIYGISRNGVFSQKTEEILQQKQTPLQAREAELSSLEAEEKKISEAENLIDQQRAGQNIGEE